MVNFARSVITFDNPCLRDFFMTFTCLKWEKQVQRQFLGYIIMNLRF